MTFLLWGNSANHCATVLYDESVGRSIVYLALVFWPDTESLGFNAEVRRQGQFEICLLLFLSMYTII